MRLRIHARHLYRRAALRRALTLTEVIISMAVFTIVSLGVLTIVTQIRHMSENTVYENTSLTIDRKSVV